VTRALVALVALAVAAGCNGALGSLDDGGDDGGNPQTSSSDREFCAQETNRLRALAGKPALARSSALEAFATAAAEADTKAMRAHGHFVDTQGGGVAFAENACPSWLGWNLGTGGGTVRGTITACLQAFYDEGPGGGHYDNLMGGYGSVGCGLYQTIGGGLTIVQDFGE
jgi:hypothetical protein